MAVIAAGVAVWVVGVGVEIGPRLAIPAGVVGFAGGVMLAKGKDLAQGPAQVLRSRVQP
ncbi:MAG: hypothetical protein O3C27_07315 [Actinomycetota bacterium]|nr:hypothetical protein [Actinomycetota bacterium]